MMLKCTGFLVILAKLVILAVLVLIGLFFAMAALVAWVQKVVQKYLALKAQTAADLCDMLISCELKFIIVSDLAGFSMLFGVFLPESFFFSW